MGCSPPVFPSSCPVQCAKYADLPKSCLSPPHFLPPLHFLFWTVSIKKEKHKNPLGPGVLCGINQLPHIASLCLLGAYTTLFVLTKYQIGRERQSEAPPPPFVYCKNDGHLPTASVYSEHTQGSQHPLLLFISKRSSIEQQRNGKVMCLLVCLPTILPRPSSPVHTHRDLGTSSGSLGAEATPCQAFIWTS